MTATCDYLIIGGGAAGCLLARRLADATDAHILLIEAGRSDENDPLACDLSRLDEQDESYDWGLKALPFPGAPYPIAYDRAKMLGGCANHNDCAFIEPPASDLEAWETLGAKGWGPAAMAPLLERIRSTLHIEEAPHGNALSRAFIDAGCALGLAETNFRRAVRPGSGWFPLNVKGSLRQSSSIACLHPLSALPKNLQVWTETFAERLTLQGARVTGAATTRGRIEARREVVLTAGSIMSPHLMMLSGLGPAAELQRHGITVAADLPGVGANLMDHVAASLAYELTEPVPAWRLTPCEATLLLKVDAEAPAPDVLYHFVLTLREKYAGRTFYDGVENGAKISPNVARAKSRGRLRLMSPDPRVPPGIDLCYFTDTGGYDRRILLAGLRFGRRLAATPALARWFAREVVPGPDATSDDELFAFARETAETVYHPCGTCRMGEASDPLAVVAPDLKVKGIAGLRVADASVFPALVTVNICNTVMMVAEKAADLIVSDS